MKRRIMTCALSLAILATSTIAYASPISYEVNKGDTYWKISSRYEVNLDELLKVNNATANPELNVGQSILIPEEGKYKLYEVKGGDTYWKISQFLNIDFDTLLNINNGNQNPVLNIGDIIKLPKGSTNKDYTLHEVKKGETYWIISQNYSVDINELLKLNKAEANPNLNIGDTIKIPNESSKPTQPDKPQKPQPDKGTEPYVTYVNHTIKSGDDFWNLSIKYGIPQYELMNANNMNEDSILYDGDVIKVPVHHVPVIPTMGKGYGEYLDWWTQAQYVVPINAVFTVRDYETGKGWTMKRTVGANHADCEPLTKADSEIMKSVWGGNFSWVARPVLIEYKGRVLAASATSMPHSNYDYIPDNGVYGHMDIHFKNSTRHKDGMISPDHQQAIKVSAGVK